MTSQCRVATRKTHDVIVIGGGLCRGTNRVRAGVDVAIVDQGPLGGLCILRGCMPIKAILRSAEVAALRNCADAERIFLVWRSASHSCSAGLCRQREVCRAEPVYLQTLKG